MSSLTAHCLIKNEEKFIRYALESVIEYVDVILVFDTGSTDTTTTIVEEVVKKYPGKIIFEQKGLCDKKRHTELRQEMIERTKTDWFMILDGDEVWTARGLHEAREVIQSESRFECVMAPFYLCVGDIYHETWRKGTIEMLGKKDFFYPRIIKKMPGVHWSGEYNEDTLRNADEEVFFNKKNSYILKKRYWHLTHLVRSNADDHEYSSGGTRKDKRILTYTIIGKKIKEPVPEVFQQNSELRLHSVVSIGNLFKLVVNRLTKRYKN